MPDIKIKGWSGTDFQYNGVPKIWLDAPESTEESPVLVPYTYGESVSKTVEPDFSAGDMAVAIPDGELVKELTIKKPETLIPENIAAGVNIADIIGIFNGNGCCFNSGVYTPEKSGTDTITITHGLGVIPDFIAVFCTASPTNDYGFIYQYGVSKTFAELTQCQYWALSMVKIGMYYKPTEADGYVISATSISQNIAGAIRNADTDTFKIGGLYGWHDATNSYVWVAIGGMN